MTSAYGKIQHTSCSPEFKWQLAVSWPITDTMRSFRVSLSLRPHPFSPVIARVEPALAWTQTLKSLCLPRKRILRTQTHELGFTRSTALCSVFHIQSWQHWAQMYSPDLEAIIFRNAQALAFKDYCWSSAMSCATNSNHRLFIGKEIYSYTTLTHRRGWWDRGRSEK